MKNQHIHDLRRQARGYPKSTPEELKKFGITRQDVMNRIKEELKKKNGD